MIDPADLAAAPRIALAGKTFVVAPVWRDLKRLIPKLIGLLPKLARPLELTEADYDAAVDVIHLAIREAHPSVTRESLDELRITPVDIAEALMGVAPAAGLKLGKPSAPATTPEPTPAVST